jgi:pantoate--beta-alanine ligase
MQRCALALKREGKRIGFVPTMGFLHEGHLSLMRIARKRCDVLVASIFVNPTQFAPDEDLEAYPRDFARDERLCEGEGVDIVFYPEPGNMYSADVSVWVDEESLSGGLCGAARPGHFRGVCSVVAKLFNLVQPDVAVFGEKDAQQLRIIERMVRDLNFPVEIIRGPIVREADGLAMSSRNKYLSETERTEAVCLSRSLKKAKELFGSGERGADELKAAIRRQIERTSGEVDYIELVDDETLSPVATVDRPVLIALAVRFAGARLIDSAVLAE